MEGPGMGTFMPAMQNKAHSTQTKLKTAMNA
jgi:hypothetical protein